MRSMLILSLAFAVAAFNASYAGVATSTAAFMTEIGIDPASPDVQSISQDVVSNKDIQAVSLDSLAAARDQEGVRQFIATRVFIHKYMVDTTTPFPSTELYNVLYLTGTERDFIFCQISKGFNASSPGC